MKISGRRADGALYLSMGAGVAVILLGDRVSPPIDETTMDALGPWTRTPEDNTLEARRIAERLLDRARVSNAVAVKQ